jgi:broad specificity phosphatase PhoE
MGHIFIFRHGETDWNVQERFQGHIDIPLNNTGRAQAKELVLTLLEKKIEAILSSDLSRAVETAQIVAQGLESHGLQVPLFQSAGLRESHLGEAQGLTREEIVAKFGETIALRWRSHKLTDADISYPGGETGTQIFERVMQSVRGFFERHPFQRIGIATHGGVIRRIMQRTLPPDSPPVPIPNGVLYELKFHRTENRFSLI